MNYQYLTIVVGSAIYLLLALTGILVACHLIPMHSKPELVKANKSIAYVSIIITLFCMWLMWICTYLHQMNPILIPTAPIH